MTPEEVEAIVDRRLEEWNRRQCAALEARLSRGIGQVSDAVERVGSEISFDPQWKSKS